MRSRNEIWGFGGFGDLEIWGFGDLGIWGFGDLGTWRSETCDTLPKESYAGPISFCCCSPRSPWGWLGTRQPAAAQPPESLVHQPYLLDTGLISRSISFENPTGAPGEGGKAASHLGVGRKGSASRAIQPHETLQLCDIEGPGTIRHFWMTTRRVPADLRNLVIRAAWDGQDHPSIECPVGDFFGCATARSCPTNRPSTR